MSRLLLTDRWVIDETAAQASRVLNCGFSDFKYRISSTGRIVGAYLSGMTFHYSDAELDAIENYGSREINSAVRLIAARIADLLLPFPYGY